MIYESDTHTMSVIFCSSVNLLAGGSCVVGAVLPPIWCNGVAFPARARDLKYRVNALPLPPCRLVA